MSDRALEKLLTACSASGGVGLIVTNEETQKQWRQHVPLPFAVVGNNPKADLGLFHPAVSWRHALLQVIEGRILCLDLQSRTGLHWGERAEESGWLDAEQDVRIGPFRLRADTAGGGGPAVTDSTKFLARLTDAASLAQVTLEFRSATLPHKSLNRTWTLDRTLTLVGKSPQCKVRFNDPGVSNFHCSLLLTPSGLWVYDLLSRTGTWVNGQSVRWAPLSAGDELRMGKFVIRLHMDFPGQASAAKRDAAGEGVLVATAAAASGPVARQAHPAIHTPGDREPQLIAAIRPLAADERRSAEELPHFLSSALASNQGEPWQAVVGSLFQQFSSMQQNMFDQFQKTLVMVVQMLNSQQQTQMEFVRDELEQIRSLNLELSSLQKRLVGYQTTAGGEAGAAKPAHGLPTTDTNVSLTLLAESRPGTSGDWLPPTRNGEATPPPSVRERQPYPSAAGPSPPAKPTTTDVAVTPTRAQAPPVHPQADKEIAPAANAATPPPPVACPEDVHRMIVDRLRAIQDERQTLWQKILKKIMGS